ncbi:MAG TPA: hypothetical protein VMS65_15590, partial [Polyangiaceae bacterium]|nr:hypothetical protein [Polyangiaceae bacterium]
MRRPHRTLAISALAIATLAIAAACSGENATVEPKGVGSGGDTASGGSTGTGGTATGGDGGTSGATGGSGGTIITPDGGGCPALTCESIGWECGYLVDDCGNMIDCADEGRMCAVNEVCVGGIGTPTQCMAGAAGTCPVCTGLPDCTGQPQVTMLSGRVITPGRDDADTGNQVGVPNATVYLLRTGDVSELPPIPTGIPADGMSCDRCEDQNLGPVLAGAVTDATGAFTIEEYVPVGVEVVLVVKVGRFRRATTLTLPESAACQTTTLPTTLPDNPTRLPRTMTDGEAVNIPRIAVTTGQIDAMECVLEKMGLDHGEFTNPSGTGRVQLFRGGNPAMGTPPGSGARIDDSTPHADALYGNAATILGYDLVVSDCEGQSWDQNFTERDASGTNVREFVNRGGRMFASHLSFSWLHENGDTPYDMADPIATGLGPAATWATQSNQLTTGNGLISIGRPNASPRIQNFADWMVNEGVTTAPAYNFTITEPRSMNTGLGAFSEEFVHLTDMSMRTQQLSFNTPYGAPASAACGRVAYSGFHVSV